ncbi:MAG: zf-TFIIB domain-containing protein [Candidatus Saccharibacteria bacterium]|nr:zf-TFIIB domain-containing protein [Candidatus Saccharibacteria bacterium]
MIELIRYLDMFPWLVIIFAVVYAVLEGPIKKYRHLNRRVHMPGSSVLLAYYTYGSELFPVKSGRIGDFYYQAIGTFSRPNELNYPALIYQVTLPFSSTLHLLGIPKMTPVAQLNPAGSIMEKVELEGDYPNYFTLFAENGMQTDSRYAMDPKAMVFTIDFCQSHSWEIVDNQLYFVQATANAPDDPTTMFEDLEEFVSQIRPAVTRPVSPAKLQQLTPLGKELRQDLKCPICHNQLHNKFDYLLCQTGDGVLLKGSALLRLHAGELFIPYTVLQREHKRPDMVICPACDSEMQHVTYNGSKIIIDACNTCGYRWLDAAEVTSETIVP